MTNDNTLPRVSVVTVVYNGAGHVRECIESVLNQTYPNIEYVIIDGGSKDGTVAIIKEYEDRIAYWVSEKDKGITDAFNKGILKTTGEIVGILNADDVYELNAVEKIVEGYHNNNQAQGIYYGDVRLVFTEGDYAYEMIPQINNIWKYMAIYHPATFVAKKVYDEQGVYDVSYRYAMDAEMMHRCLMKQVPFIYVNSTLTNFRMGGASDKNMHASYREFYRSVKRYHPGIKSFYRYCFGVGKAYFVKTKLGALMHSKRHLFASLLSAKPKITEKGKRK